MRLWGVELSGETQIAFGLFLGANYTWIRSKDLINPTIPYTNTYSSRLNFTLRYDAPRNNWWAEYRLRINGRQQDVIMMNNPIGPTIPGYIVHDLSAGITLFKKSRTPQRLGVILANVGNTLYAEFSNATFFRPAPKRHLVITWNSSF